MKKHITLCGSMVFMDRMRSIADELETYGFSVICPSLTEEEKKSGAKTFMDMVTERGGVMSVPPHDSLWKIKEEAIREYKHEIDKADAILVCNFDKREAKNYIGDNSFLEMGYAFFMGKKIFVLQEPPYESSKIEEILGMRPVFLHGDIGGIYI